jgi:hypothetical protein
MVGIFEAGALQSRTPLISLKLSEVATGELAAVERRLDILTQAGTARVFLHTFTDSDLERRLLRSAASVYCGNAEIAERVADERPDAIELWCPGTILGQDRFQPVEVSVLSFGMAHKVRSDYYLKLHRLLASTGRSFGLFLSTALHENTSFDESFEGAFEEIRIAFGEQAHFLGFLSDTAIYNRMLDSTFFAAFFEQGVRSNNTSVNAAMACGAVVITNLDSYSPASFVHGENVLDIERLESLSLTPRELQQISARARQVGTGRMGWPALLARLRELEAKPGGTNGAEPRRDIPPSLSVGTGGSVSSVGGLARARSSTAREVF